MSSVQDLFDRGLKVHDVDTHVTEPPDLWVSRVSRKWGDLIPHVVKDPKTGYEALFTGDNELIGVACQAAAGWKDFYPSFPPTLADAIPAAWQPKPRLEWMDEYGIYSQIIYPNILGFLKPEIMRLDDQLKLELVQAYNDFQTEFCSVAPNRLIALTYLPWWNVDQSLVELQRCADSGHRGVILPWEFDRAGLPPLHSDHWTRLLGAIQECDQPISFHIGFSNKSSEEVPIIRVQDEDLGASIARIGQTLLGNSNAISEVILGGICHRFPTLKFVSVESGVGFIPYFLDGLDWTLGHFEQPADFRERLSPSEYFRRQVYGTFWFEEGVGRVADYYPENFMFETDFPHSTSLSPGPNSPAKPPREVLIKHLDGLPEDLIINLVQNNAARLYRLEPFRDLAPSGSSTAEK